MPRLVATKHPPEPTPPTKQCFACKQFKTLDNFRPIKDASGKLTRLYPYCTPCDNAKQRKSHRAKRGDAFKEPRPNCKPGHHWCCLCKTEKPVSEFCKNVKAKSGLSAACKSCYGVQARKHYLKRTYGITPEEYTDMLVAQDGVCAICQKPETVIHMGKTPNLSVDHDHKTGVNRSLLCYSCNLFVGYVDRFGVEAAYDVISYLEHHNSSEQNKRRH